MTKITDQSIIRRFEDKIFYSPCGCWFWTGALTKDGYGSFAEKSYTTQKANRISYRIYKGEIPNNLHVLHSCDNPACVNPDHLRTGSHQENMDDKMKRGRFKAMIGAKNYNTKLTESQVMEIRELSKKGVYQIEIANKFNISQPSVSAIILRKNWAHIKD